ncbi:hypothetical protein PTSG_13021 [Salpingoeca rosetta]|uniref:Thiolase N-terminal domain-containing protein n=1 Tax=Salpingoeca rosetta (strain ATCC 50818 / BSB-021) TaxID=946362 RepID=F2UQX7_SALR5|nr:uncharacterized protein PTSG_13021 [Salpingoeca rosetta]EGD80032.1 hypothetical protein PTSG_13021 [Salpingoeca rosetta]|eukprot:XP_004988357.1 hypothetical protein PTSG_13021 [Salpingoeca rosetta]
MLSQRAAATTSAVLPRLTAASARVNTHGQRRTASLKAAGPRVALIEGVRTPFLMSGTDYNDMQCHDLSREALKALLKRTAIDKSLIDYVCVGNVLQEVRTSNVAREVSAHHA